MSPPAEGADSAADGAMTYRLPSPAGAVLWTTHSMEKVLREAPPPVEEGQRLSLHAARNEFEPLQLIVRTDAVSTVTLALSPFTGPSTLSRMEIRRVEYVRISQPSDASSLVSSTVPDPLVLTSFDAAQTTPEAQNQPFWITIYVPRDAPAGDYAANLTVTVNGSAASIPVSLHVFDFAIPDAVGFDGNWNTSFSALGGSSSLSTVQDLKTFFFEHRLTPSSVSWPAGLNYNGGIEYDCASGAFREEANDYDFSRLGPKYIDGLGWNGIGFPSFQIMQFVDNSTPRPQSFCGVDRGTTAFGTDAYNTEWSKLLSAIDAYLVSHGWASKGYYYVQNEPQDEADYEIAAFLLNLSKTAAPHLRLAISEEPKPAIVEHARAGGRSYDLWWANLSHFEPVYAATRQAAGDQIWWYFLYGDRPPHFNPITIDHPGIESRIAYWAAWKYRIRGFAYYSVTGWGDDPYANPRPQGTDQNGDGFLLYPPKDGQPVSSIRWELLRDGQEDYEYLRLAAGGQVPATPSQAAGCDASAASAVSSPTSFTRDAAALLRLRNQLGTYLEGKSSGCPVLTSKAAGAHARVATYLNFQDPRGQPTANPLIVNGHEWTKIGWEAYQPEKGYGWAGPYIGQADIMLSQFVEAPVDELQRSVLYNDYGRTDTFNWDIENGRYSVTVSIGWYGRSYTKQRVVVEGQILFDDEATTSAQPYKVKSVTVDVTDGNVTLEVGQFDEYTMLNWMSIEPVG